MGKVREGPRPGKVCLCPLCILPSKAAVIGVKEAAVFFCSSRPRFLALRMWLAVLVRSGEHLRLGSGNQAIASLARSWLSASLLLTSSTAGAVGSMGGVVLSVPGKSCVS